MMWCLRLLFLILLLHGVQCRSTFRFGAVLSTVGATMAMEEVKNGYETYIDKINAESNGRGFFLQGNQNTTGFHFTYEFLWREDLSETEKHAEQLKELIDEAKVDFIGGSHPTYAADEMRIANESGVLNYQCCVGPDELYERDYATVFGIPASNREYTKMTIRTLSLQNISRMSIVYEESNDFTRTTCEAAVAYSEEAGAVQASRNSTIVRQFNKTTIESGFFEDVAAEAKEMGVEAVIACVFPTEGKQLVDAMHNIEHPLKAFFLTTGPTKQEWVDSYDPTFRANDLLSSAQWHHDMKYGDSCFPTTMQYAEVFMEKHGQPPTYTAAAASAVGVSLTQAIRNAFVHCDISKTKGDVDALLYDPDVIECDDALGDLGYDRVLHALAELDMETFFGRVKFNYYRRNVGLDPVTTQVFERRALDGTVYREIEAVLPLGYATELMHFPAENYYREVCKPGHYVGDDSFMPCLPCEQGESADGEDAPHCDSCPIGEWTNKTAQSRCVKCPAGTHTESRGAKHVIDCVCKEGFFNAAGESGVECETCPVGAKCDGGTELPIPLPGFWANETRRTNVYQCDPLFVCKGGKEVACEKGYIGRLCAQCEDGYFSALQVCYECLAPGVIVLMCIALLIGWYVINVTVSRSVTSLEIILGWAQLANIIGDVNLNWTGMVTTMFGVANLLDFDVDILEPSCIVCWGFKENFVTQLLLPFVMSIMAASGYLGSAIAYVMVQRQWVRVEGRRNGLLSVFVEVPEDREQLSEKWDATIATFLASVDVTYVTIAKYCFDVFKCENIAGVSVLREAPDVVCGNADHGVLIGLASFGIAFYVIGYLLYISWKIFDLRRNCAFSDGGNLRRFGFVYEKFELDYSFTPAINIVRKLLFVSVLVYMNNPAFQVGMLAIIINASLMLHVYCAPYVDTHFDILYSFLLIALMFEAFGGLMFYSENLPDANRNILEWIVITTLLVLSVVFVTILIMEMAKKYYVRYLKRMHKKYVRRNLKPRNNLFTLTKMACKSRSLKQAATRMSLGSLSSFVAQRREQFSFELLDTFDPSFVYSCIRKNPESIKDWDKLSNMLKDFVSDQSETSYLSMDPTAKFWRKLVDRFPELVDFLAVADDATRESFKTVATNLYRNFYLTKKVTPLPLMGILNWRDYAPMAQWLAIAPAADREFFLKYITDMFRFSGNEEAAEMLESRQLHGGMDPHLARRQSIGRRTDRKARILTRVSSGSDPFVHSAAKKSLYCHTATDKSSTHDTASETMPEDASQPSAPITPNPSCASTPRVVVGSEQAQAGSSSSSDGPEEINADGESTTEQVSERERLDKQSSIQSSGSTTNKSVTFAE